jgi:serine/threonine-protein kinase
VATRTSIRAAQVARIIIALLVIVVLVIVIVLIYSLFRMFSNDVLRGGAVVEVPDVVGLAEEQAEARLSEVGLVAQDRYKQRLHSDLQPVGCVFKQEPTAGSKTKRTRVKLWISLGKASFIIPRLTGSQLSEAIVVVRDSGLQLGKITKVYHPGITPGEVVNQDPQAGKEYTSAVSVDLVVVDSGNLPPVTMPELRGEKLNSAENLLVDANLHLAKVTYVADDTVPDTTVIRQSVAAETQVDLGSRIELDVALPTALMEKPVKTITIHVPVPAGPERQTVKIKVFDDHSPQGSVVYEQEQAAGSVVDRREDLAGNAVIYIFIGDLEHPYREVRIEGQP